MLHRNIAAVAAVAMSVTLGSAIAQAEGLPKTFAWTAYGTT